jgi:hypothetical protein
MNGKPRLAGKPKENHSISNMGLSMYILMYLEIFVFKSNLSHSNKDYEEIL